MLPDEVKLRELKGKAQGRFDEIARLMLDGEHSLTQLLVKAHRVGHERNKAEAAFIALKQCVSDAEATYHAAIAQPEPKIAVKSRVVL
jgi:hypothetical protein